MADYIVHGKKGNGKTLVCVGRIRDALLEGRPVATNLDLSLEFLLPLGLRRVTVYRLPDRPTIDDLLMVGRGSSSVDESTYGLIVLDECASMLNARTFSDKGRAAFLDWFVHSRKLGWDTYFICQNPVQIDKQVRESLVELSVACKRMDRLRVPFLGVLTKTFLGIEVRPPKIHIATVRYGVGADCLISDRWVYRGTDLYKGYDTRQVFKEGLNDGVFSLLSPWHLSAVVGLPGGAAFVGPCRPGPIDLVLLSGRKIERKKGEHMAKYMGLVLLFGALLGVMGHKYFSKPVSVVAGANSVADPSVRKYAENFRSVGVLRNGSSISVILSDGRMVAPISFITVGASWEAQIEPNLWVKGGTQ